MEIYNESVRDLLGADATPLRLLDDPEVIFILGVKSCCMLPPPPTLISVTSDCIDREALLWRGSQRNL